jgi:16S rRNA (guanine966-N2)-methyltransferase
LQASAQTLRAAAGTVEVVRSDALEFLARDRRIYDVIFVDPPYALWERSDGFAATLLAKLKSHLKPDARVYLESAAQPDLPPGWGSLRQGRAGAVHYQLLNYQPPGDQAE